jgi:hypothetical protein
MNHKHSFNFHLILLRIYATRGVPNDSMPFILSMMAYDKYTYADKEDMQERRRQQHGILGCLYERPVLKKVGRQERRDGDESKAKRLPPDLTNDLPSGAAS